MNELVVVKTPESEYTLEDLECYMDLHGIGHIDEAVQRLNQENEAKRDPVRFLIRFITE